MRGWRRTPRPPYPPEAARERRRPRERPAHPAMAPPPSRNASVPGWRGNAGPRREEVGGGPVGLESLSGEESGIDPLQLRAPFGAPAVGEDEPPPGLRGGDHQPIGFGDVVPDHRLPSSDHSGPVPAVVEPELGKRVLVDQNPIVGPGHVFQPADHRTHLLTPGLGVVPVEEHSASTDDRQQQGGSRHASEMSAQRFDAGRAENVEEGRGEQHLPGPSVRVEPEGGGGCRRHQTSQKDGQQVGAAPLPAEVNHPDYGQCAEEQAGSRMDEGEEGEEIQGAPDQEADGRQERQGKKLVLVERGRSAFGELHRQREQIPGDRQDGTRSQADQGTRPRAPPVATAAPGQDEPHHQDEPDAAIEGEKGREAEDPEEEGAAPSPPVVLVRRLQERGDQQGGEEHRLAVDPKRLGISDRVGSQSDEEGGRPGGPKFPSGRRGQAVDGGDHQDPEEARQETQPGLAATGGGVEVEQACEARGVQSDRAIRDQRVTLGSPELLALVVGKAAPAETDQANGRSKEKDGPEPPIVLHLKRGRGASAMAWAASSWPRAFGWASSTDSLSSEGG